MRSRVEADIVEMRTLSADLEFKQRLDTFSFHGRDDHCGSPELVDTDSAGKSTEHRHLQPCPGGSQGQPRRDASCPEKPCTVWLQLTGASHLGPLSAGFCRAVSPLHLVVRCRILHDRKKSRIHE